MISLIVSDLDGTLLNEDQKVSKANKKAMWQSYEKGVNIALCSGRGAQNIRDIIKEEGLPPSYALGYNGAQCLDIDGRELNSTYFQKSTLKTSISHLEKEKVMFAMMWKKGVAINEPLAQSQAINRSSFEEIIWVWESLTWDKDTFDEAAKTGVFKILYLDDNPIRIEKIKTITKNIKDVIAVSSWHDNVELMPSNINKGIAVKNLAKRLNIPSQHIMALGDQENDKDMIAFAGLGIAMGNAIDQIKNLAKYVTSHHQEDGVAKALKRYVLQ